MRYTSKIINKAVELRKEGYTWKQISELMQLPFCICQAVRYHKGSVPRPHNKYLPKWKRNTWDDKRYEEVLGYRAVGMTYKEIAECYGVSKQCIHRNLQRYAKENQK